MISLYTSFFDFYFLLLSSSLLFWSYNKLSVASNPAKCIFYWKSSNSSSFSISLSPKLTSSNLFISLILTPLCVRLIFFITSSSCSPYSSNNANFLAFFDIFIILLFFLDYITLFCVSVSFYIFFFLDSANLFACLPNAEPWFYWTAAEGFISFVDLYFFAMLKSKQLYYITLAIFINKNLKFSGIIKLSTFYVYHTFSPNIKKGSKQMLYLCRNIEQLI